MLLKLVLENIFSFAERTVIDFSSGREQNFSDHLPYIKKFNKKVSPVSFFFGANGSGKTCIFKTISIVKQMVLEPFNENSLIPIEPFLLQKNRESGVSFISLEFLADDDLYTYDLTLSKSLICSEVLVKKNSNSEKIIYKREGKKIEPNADYSEDIKSACKFACINTAKNQLILSTKNKALSEYIKEVKVVLNWFKRLLMVTPETSFIPFTLSPGNYEELSLLLREYGINVNSITGEDCSFDVVPDFLRKEICSKITEKRGALFVDREGEFIVTYVKNGEVKARRLFCWHKVDDKTLVKFSLKQESDGTRRIIEISPILYILSNSSSYKYVVIVDELDNRLHHLLTSYIIKKFIKASSAASRSQLVFTSHDLSLLNRKIFRQDQIFIVGKDENQSSYVNKLNDSKLIRSDKDLRNFYLERNLGGLPEIEEISL